MLGWVLGCASGAAKQETPVPDVGAPANPSEGIPMEDPNEAPVLRFSVTHEDRSKDSQTYLVRYTLTAAALSVATERLAGRPPAGENHMVALDPATVARLLDSARGKGLAADLTVPEVPFGEPGVRTRIDVELDGHRWAVEKWELFDGPAAPAPDPRVLAARVFENELRAAMGR